MTERYMDIADFRRDGYLQEVNRRLLHPLGLALEVVVHPDGSETLGQIQDLREDPEGVYYGPGVIDSGKAHRIGHELMARYGRRKARLGYVIQPADGGEPP